MTSTHAIHARSAAGASPTVRSTRPFSALPRRGTVLVFSPATAVDLDLVYRHELTLTGSRSATPRHMREALALLPTLDLPEPTVLPLEQFEEGLDLYRSGRALKVVFTP
jgi:threonine dehydrogenase-like Zn-dependent dehydrogenase